MQKYEHKLDMSNIADNNEFKNSFCRQTEKIKKQCGSYKISQKELDGFTLQCRHFSNDKNSMSCNCCEYTLMDGDVPLYSYDSIDASHINEIVRIGETNFFFYMSGLYGYNVYNIRTGNCFHYFPKASEGYITKKDFEETFIWTDIHYNERNGILAAGGCYWASPYKVMLYNIPDPEKMFVGIADADAFFDDKDAYIEDIDFVSWNGNDLVLKYSISYDDGDTFEEREICIPEERYMSEMRRAGQEDFSF